MFMNTKSTGYGEDTGWKARYRLSTFNFGPHERSLNTNTVRLPVCLYCLSRVSMYVCLYVCTVRTVIHCFVCASLQLYICTSRTYQYLTKLRKLGLQICACYWKVRTNCNCVMAHLPLLTILRGKLWNCSSTCVVYWKEGLWCALIKRTFNSGKPKKGWEFGGKDTRE
jgi:hypothetical protein